MIIYSPLITHRLRYVADTLSGMLTGQPARITDREEEFRAAEGFRINYSNRRILPEEIWILPHPLLFEKGIREQDTTCSDWRGRKVFFKSDGDIPFDLFAAAFYLLSRYEEYLPHLKDRFGRYAHEQSLAFREGFLDRPLVNIWLSELAGLWQEKFPALSFSQPGKNRFQFLPTYDIDEAWSFQHKQWWRSAGASLKDLLLLRFGRFRLRRRVLNHEEPDPFDSYAWIDDLHRPHSVQPLYFFLVAGKNGKYDKNILPSSAALQTLIRRHDEKYSIGVHPSWQSGDNPALIGKEKETIEGITKKKIIASRQHFIRFRLPDTYRSLLDAGIREDFSMGYGSINGFRASVATAYFWFDLEKDQQTPLLLYPFCYMEANSFFERHATPQQALEEMRHYYREVKEVKGLLISIWHNTFLGTDSLFSGWREVYARFVKEIMT